MPRPTTLLSLLVLALADARSHGASSRAGAQPRDNQTTPQPVASASTVLRLAALCAPAASRAASHRRSAEGPYVPLGRSPARGVSWRTPLPHARDAPHCHRQRADAPTTSSFDAQRAARWIPTRRGSFPAPTRARPPTSAPNSARRGGARPLHGSPPARVLRCDSAAASLDAALLIIVGVPTRLIAPRRAARGGARATWPSAPQVGRTVVACFLLSTEVARKADLAERVVDEAVASGDLVLLQAPESRSARPSTPASRRRGAGCRRSSSLPSSATWRRGPQARALRRQDRRRHGLGQPARAPPRGCSSCAA